MISRRASRVQDLAENGMMALVVLALLVLVGLPMAFIMLSAFLKDPFNAMAGFSLEGIIDVYTSPRIWSSALQTLLMSVAVGLISTIVGGVLAWTLTRFKLPASGLIETLCVVPLFLSPLVGAIAWIAIASPRSGILNELLRNIGAPDWMLLNVMSLPGICFVMVFHFSPYGFLFLSSALRNTDAAMEEASYMCGRGVIATALTIVLPLLRSSFLSSFLFISILTSGEFAVAAILGAKGTYQPLSVHLYDAIYGFPADFTRATGIATIMVIASLTAFYFYRRSVRDSRRFVTVSGPWRIPILVMFGFYALVTVILPYLALIFISLIRFRTGDLASTEFTFDNIIKVWNTAGVQLALINTFILSLIVPVLCVAIGVFLVYIHERLKLRGTSLALYIATSPIAVSHIVFATGFLVIYIHTPLYGTLWVIALALIAAYLAHAVRIAGNGLSQLDPSLEEAAQINGASRGKVLMSIVVPLLRPSIFSAIVLIYVFAVREVNTAILLYSPSSLLLSVLSWNYMADGSLAPAAIIGMIQTVMMVGGIVLARLFLGTRSTHSL
jgi:iron(III) transport system permease protein